MKVTDDMQHQAKALADPSRFRLFRHITDASGPVGVAELTELLGFNHNAIRQHLAVLVDAGLVAETDEHRTVRGRPRKQYTPRRDALNAFRSVSGSYQRLAELLLRLTTSGDEPYEVGFAAAQVPDANAEGERDPATVIKALARELAADGFEPLIKDSIAVLGNCPFADVASEAPGVVCELHRGLIDGHLAHYGEGLAGDLVPRDPHTAGCKVAVALRRQPGPGA